MSFLLYEANRDILLTFIVICCTAFFCVERPMLRVAGLMVTWFVIHFFREPRHSSWESGDQVVFSPSYGKVTDIIEHDNGSTTVSIFLHVFDVHAQYCPVDGHITRREYFPGKFHPAQIREKTKDNERQVTVFENSDKEEIVVTQIAGFIARRIVNFSCKTEYKKGEPYGMIRFGSRVDVTLPSSQIVIVHKGQRVYGPETIISIPMKFE